MSGPAMLIAGTHSGSGKTTITLGIMAALKKLGHSVMPFKCGPDFIDPSLHRLVTGSVSRNLDLWMAGESFCQDCFQRHRRDTDIAVIEGVMGMFDGGVSSSAALAGALHVPVILVLDVRSAAESGAAVLKGFETFDPAIRPQGVILNMVGSSRHFTMVRDAIKKHCQAEILGYLPRTLEFTIPSRHLGLHMGEESPITAERVEKLAASIIDHIDMERLVEIADTSQALKSENLKPRQNPDPTMRLAVARDKAFCFYYEDNLEIFQSCGAEICFFSPLEDVSLPADIDGIYLGGGYPELYAKELSRNKSLLKEIKTWAEDGRPIYAECGGFMYLTEGIIDLEDEFHQLASVFPGSAVMQTKRANLGYRQVTTAASSFFGPEHTVMRGHEFHYSRIEEMNSSIERVYSVENNPTEGYRYKNTLGGYMHLHFGFNREAARNFIQFCTSFSKE